MIDLLLDLDGTVYLSNQIINRSDIWIRSAWERGVKINYMTNNTSVSLETYKTKLQSMGIYFPETKIISPTTILSDWIIQNGVREIFLVGTDGLRSDLENLTGIVTNSDNPELVVVGFDTELTFEKIKRASEHINSGVVWYQTHIDLNCPSSKGPIPDCGAISKLLEATTGVPPKDHFGKPGWKMVDFLKGEFSSSTKIIVIGDRLYTDVEIGLRLNAETILVCSGEFQPDGKDLSNDSIKTFSDLSTYLKFFLENC